MIRILGLRFRRAKFGEQGSESRVWRVESVSRVWRVDFGESRSESQILRADFGEPSSENRVQKADFGEPRLVIRVQKSRVRRAEFRKDAFG